MQSDERSKQKNVGKNKRKENWNEEKPCCGWKGKMKRDKRWNREEAWRARLVVWSRRRGRGE